jgi:hypothetical protein
MSAKSVVYQTDPLTNALALVMHAILPAQSIFLLGGDGSITWIVAALLGTPFLIALAVSGVRQWMRAGLGASIWLLFPTLYIVAYAVAGLRGVRMFHWYLVPLLPFYALILAGGSQGLARRVPGRPSAAGVLIGVVLIAWWLPGILASGQPGYPAGFSLARERLYRQVALEYATDWGEGTVVAAPEIGTIGYYIRADILDTVGLVSPFAAAYYPLPAELLASDNAIAPRLIHDARPDYVVSLDQFMRNSLGADPEFQREYRLLQARSAPIWDSTQLLIFQRVDRVTAGE